MKKLLVILTLLTSMSLFAANEVPVLKSVTLTSYAIFVQGNGFDISDNHVLNIDTHDFSQISIMLPSLKPKTYVVKCDVNDVFNSCYQVHDKIRAAFRDGAKEVDVQFVQKDFKSLDVEVHQIIEKY